MRISVFIKTMAALTLGSLSASAQEYWFQHLQVETNAMSYDPLGDGLGNGQFLAAGKGAIWFSDTGELWNGHLVDGTHQDVVRFNGRYVGVGATAGGKKLISVSDDSFSWTPILFNETGTFTGVHEALGALWCVGDGGDLRRSADGLVWTPVTIPAEYAAVPLRSVHFGNSRLLVTGAVGKLLTSLDGTAWTTFTIPTTSRIMAATFGNGFFVVGTEAGTIYTSPDGATWTLRAILTFEISRLGFTDDVATFFIATGNYDAIASSRTGEVWDTIEQDTYSTRIIPINSLAFGEGKFVANSLAGDLYQIIDPYQNYFGLISGAWEIRSLAYGDGVFFGVGDKFTTSVWDGVSGWDIDHNPGVEDKIENHYKDVDFSTFSSAFWVAGYDYLESFADLPADNSSQIFSMAAYYDTRTQAQIDAGEEDTNKIPLVAVASGGGYLLALSFGADGRGYTLWDEATMTTNPASAISSFPPTTYKTDKIWGNVPWNDAVYGEDANGNPIFIAVGNKGFLWLFEPIDDGVPISLPNGIPQVRPPGTGDDLVDVTYVDDPGAGVKGFYAVSSAGAISHSTDGYYWRSLRIANMSSEVPTAIRYGNEHLVVVCKSGAIFTTVAADGAYTGGINPTWTKRPAAVQPLILFDPTSPLLEGLAYGGDKFAAIGNETAISSYPVSATPIILPPVILAADTATGKVGVSFSLTFETNNDIDTIVLAGEIPPGLAISGSKITGTPTTAGVYDLQIVAEGDGGSTTKNILVTIAAASGTVPEDPDEPEVIPETPVNPPSSTPEAVDLIGASSVKGKVNKQFSYTLNASGPVQSYQLGKLPFGLRRSGNRIVGKPKAAGTYFVTITANGPSNSDSIRLKIVIKP